MKKILLSLMVLGASCAFANSQQQGAAAQKSTGTIPPDAYHDTIAKKDSKQMPRQTDNNKSTLYQRQMNEKPSANTK
jgi:hypothetical protein